MSGTTHAYPAARGAELALRALGLRCRVEARGTLAVVIPAPDDRTLEDAVARRATLAALRAHGFTHAAVEVSEEVDPAPESAPADE